MPIRRAAAITSLSSPGSSDQVGVVGASATRDKPLWRSVVETLGAGFDRLEHAVERFNRLRRVLIARDLARLGGAAAAEYKTKPKAARNLEDHLRRVVAEGIAEKIMVVGDRRRARKQQFRKPDPGRNRQRLLVEFRPIAIRHRVQPAGERQINAGPHALQHALEQMMVGRDQAGIDHPAAGIEPEFAGRRLERADLDDHAVADPDLDRSCASRRPEGR